MKLNLPFRRPIVQLNGHAPIRDPLVQLLQQFLQNLAGCFHSQRIEIGICLAPKYLIRYLLPVIESFSDKATVQVFEGQFSRKPPRGDIQAPAKVKLTTIHHAAELQHLTHPTSNNLEALAGNLKGLHSIRINKQWRITFRWENGNAHDVKITDYR